MNVAIVSVTDVSVALLSLAAVCLIVLVVGLRFDGQDFPAGRKDDG